MANPQPDRRGPRPTECVSLIHGFLAHRLLLGLLSRRLRDRGFQTRVWGYRNMACSILRHAERFAGELGRLDADPCHDRVHIVAHSMGCIITRAALAMHRPTKLGRVVMLAPPNRGSAFATAAEGIFGRIFQPVRELTTAPTSLVNTLPMPVDLDLGIVAAGHDALVHPDSTRPHVPHDHVTVPCWHSSLLFRRDAAELVAGFLREGAFRGSIPGVVSDAAGAPRSAPRVETAVATSDAP